MTEKESYELLGQSFIDGFKKGLEDATTEDSITESINRIIDKSKEEEE